MEPDKEIIQEKLLRGALGSYRELNLNSSQGAFGVSGTARADTHPSPNERVFVKLPNLPNSGANFHASRDKLGRIFSGIFSEFANYQSLRGLDCVAQVYDAGIYAEQLDGYVALLPFLVQQFVEGKNLRELLWDANGRLIRMLPNESFLVAIKAVLDVVGKVHSRDIVHGDIHPGNFMAKEESSNDVDWSSIKIVDFGQAFLALANLSAPEHSPGKMEHTYKAPERRLHGMHWTKSADIYSVGITMFALACGREPTEPLPTSDTVSFITDQIQHHNPQLLTFFPSLPQIIAKAAHTDVSRRYASVEQILRDLDVLSIAYNPPPQPSKNQIKKMILASERVSDGNPFFRDIAVDAFEEFQRDILQLTKQRVRYDLVGDRETLISRLLRYLSILGEGDEYLTITTPTFWQPNNLGASGRFMAMNEIMLRRKVQVHRLFLVTEEQLSGPLFEQIVQAHKSVAGRISATSSDQKGKFQFNYEKVTEEQLREVQGPGHIVGLWVKDNTFTAIGFGLDDSTGQLSRATFMELTSEYGQAQRESMLTRISNGNSLESKNRY